MTNNNSYGGGQNTYNPLKNKRRNKKIITIIIFLVLIVVSISFAIFSPSINLLGRRNIKISKCELDINFKESDELMLVSKYPISTRQALEGGYKPKTVTITNNSTCDMAYYKLTIKDLINSSINKDVIQYHVVDKQNTMTYKLGDTNDDGQIKTNDKTIANRYVNDFAFNFLNYTLIAADLNGDGQVDETDIDLYTKYMSTKEITTFPAGAPLEEKTTTKEIINVNPDTFLIENSLEKGQTHEYEIIMWISNAATNNDLYVNGDTTKPIEYKYALNIESSDEEIKNKAMTASEFALANVGKNGLEEVKESDTVTSYRYRGKNVNNYVIFNDETWRLIGAIPTENSSKVTETRFKLVKSEDFGTTNVEKTSELCNISYYNSLSKITQSMIDDIMYTAYDDNGIYWNNPKVGLIKMDDYNYSSSKECTKTCQNSWGCSFQDDATNCITNNWLYYEKNTCTIETEDTGVYLYRGILPNGSATLFSPEFSDTCYVYPTVYLSSNVKISGGSGTSSDPYQLTLE